MTLGEQIITLRKEKGFSQNELGKKAGTSGDLIGKYERNETKPSIDVVLKIANALDVSLDYLVGKSSLQFDKKIINRIEEITKLPAEAKKQVFMVVDALIRDFKAKQAYTF